MTNSLSRRITTMVATLASLGFIISMPIGFVSADDHDIIGTQTDEGNLNNGVNDLITCLGNFINPTTICVGTNHKDKMVGQGPQTMYGLDGDDIIQGNSGPDLIYGGDGDDTIQGGEGSDTIFGQDGNDVIFGDSGTNVVFGGGGNTLYGGAGDDKLFGGSDDDILVGGSGHDSFDCNEGSDTVVDYDPQDDTVNPNCEVLQ